MHQRACILSDKISVLITFSEGGGTYEVNRASNEGSVTLHYNSKPGMRFPSCDPVLRQRLAFGTMILQHG